MKQLKLVFVIILLIFLISLVGLYIYFQEMRMQKVEETTVQTAQVVEEIKSLLIHETTNIKYSKQDEECMAKNIYHEAGVESSNGKIAVGQITLNRLKTKRWGTHICDVVYAKSQFSWTMVKDKRSEQPTGPIWEKSKIAAKQVLGGIRLRTLQSSLFYHTNYIKPPAWADKKAIITQIDKHIFYANTLQAPNDRI